MKRIHAMPFGAHALEGGGVQFSLWAPAAELVVLEHKRGDHGTSHAMSRAAGGWHRLVLPRAGAGDRYLFRLPDGLRVPDPASRYNPQDVHAASEVVDPQAYEWRDADWRGRPWQEAVVYELHVGTFTPEGSFAALQRRLPDLAALGITAVELMPVADFPGRRNWGYDGVLPFAPDAAYGRPDELKALVDAAHALGLMMFIDVVYNHFGPEGNYLHAYSPQFFNPARQTPWGAAINFDAADARTVRDFFVHNALYWLEEFHFDGLRLDAVHAIRDDSERHIVREICEAVHAGPGRRRQIHVVLENDANQASFLARDPQGRPLAATAQWNDDLHHAGHVLTTGETDGYYGDYARAPLALFGRALAEGFVYQGQASPFRDGRARGEPSTHLPLSAFVSFLQSHDQVGNRALGERLHALGDAALVQAATACVLLSPHVPMLFMGEEFAASTPFHFFCDFGPELAAAVARGRREEFRRFKRFSAEAARARMPDPNAESTFLASKLRWSERDAPAHQPWLAEVRQLLALRRRLIVPLLGGPDTSGVFECRAATLRVVWTLFGSPRRVQPARLHLLAHFGSSPAGAVGGLPGRRIYARGTQAGVGGRLHLARGAVCVALEEVADVR